MQRMSPKERSRLIETAKADLRKYGKVVNQSINHQIKKLDAMARQPTTQSK